PLFNTDQCSTVTTLDLTRRIGSSSIKIISIRQKPRLDAFFSNGWITEGGRDEYFRRGCCSYVDRSDSKNCGKEGLNGIAIGSGSCDPDLHCMVCVIYYDIRGLKPIVISVVRRRIVIGP